MHAGSPRFYKSALALTLHHFSGKITDCSKILILGHSFVSRLNEFIQDDDLATRPEYSGLNFCGLPGATLEVLKNYVRRNDLRRFNSVILCIGSNDICNRLDIENLVAEILEYARSLVREFGID